MKKLGIVLAVVVVAGLVFSGAVLAWGPGDGVGTEGRAGRGVGQAIVDEIAGFGNRIRAFLGQSNQDACEGTCEERQLLGNGYGAGGTGQGLGNPDCDGTCEERQLLGNGYGAGGTGQGLGNPDCDGTCEERQSLGTGYRAGGTGRGLGNPDCDGTCEDCEPLADQMRSQDGTGTGNAWGMRGGRRGVGR
jgi:hypothetical protein